MLSPSPSRAAAPAAAAAASPPSTARANTPATPATAPATIASPTELVTSVSSVTPRPACPLASLRAAWQQHLPQLIRPLATRRASQSQLFLLQHARHFLVLNARQVVLALLPQQAPRVALIGGRRVACAQGGTAALQV